MITVRPPSVPSEPASPAFGWSSTHPTFSQPCLRAGTPHQRLTRKSPLPVPNVTDFQEKSLDPCQLLRHLQQEMDARRVRCGTLTTVRTSQTSLFAPCCVRARVPAHQRPITSTTRFLRFPLQQPGQRQAIGNRPLASRK